MEQTLYLAPATRGGGVYEYFNRTILNGIDRDFYVTHTNEEYGDKARVWGITSIFETTWEGIEPDDWILFYTRKNKYEYAAQVSDKEHNPGMGDAIRREIIHADEGEDRDWDLLIFFDKPISVSASGDCIADLLGYNNDYPVRFIPVTQDRMTSIENEYETISRFINSIKRD